MIKGHIFTYKKSAIKGFAASIQCFSLIDKQEHSFSTNHHGKFFLH